MLLMVHVPVDITSHELIVFIGNYESKMESIKIIRDHNKDQYMVLLKFFEQGTRYFYLKRHIQRPVMIFNI